MTTEPIDPADHRPYWNRVLAADYCVGDGEPWPCLEHREAQVPRPRCQCSHGGSIHTAGRGQCWVSVCACEKYTDPLEAAIARHPAGKRLTDDQETA